MIVNRTSLPGGPDQNELAVNISISNISRLKQLEGIERQYIHLPDCSCHFPHL
jgi:hypothetical protein